MKVWLVPLDSVRHKRELGDAENLASDILDARLPHRTISIEDADVESVWRVTLVSTLI